MSRLDFVVGGIESSPAGGLLVGDGDLFGTGFLEILDFDL